MYLFGFPDVYNRVVFCPIWSKINVICTFHRPHQRVLDKNRTVQLPFCSSLGKPLLLLHDFSSFTEVWLGEYQGGKVAIKMLKDLRDAKASQLFLREASVMT